MGIRTKTAGGGRVCGKMEDFVVSGAWYRLIVNLLSLFGLVK